MLPDPKRFAEAWIAVWNSHDLARILDHYSDDLVVTTPMIALAVGGGTGTLAGKEAVGAYWRKALEKIPDLHFTLIDVTCGVDSIALYYRSVMEKCAVEVMWFDAQGKINRMVAHYS